MIISLGRKGGLNTIMTDVLYIEKEPILGSFNRGEILAQEMANKLEKQVMYYSQSMGGSSCGPVKPKHE